ncbi:MAG TPA: hypothetical protein VNV63_07970, partial [Nitrospiria bacterium]|nr:hypothetical protein [Nitrospiria bacterium]
LEVAFREVRAAAFVAEGEKPMGEGRAVVIAGPEAIAAFPRENTRIGAQTRVFTGLTSRIYSPRQGRGSIAENLSCGFILFWLRA